MGEINDAGNGRVTTSQFYRLQIEMIQKQDEMERRIMGKLEDLPAVCRQVETNKEEIEKLRSKSNLFDVINGFIAVIAATLAAILGKP